MDALPQDRTDAAGPAAPTLPPLQVLIDAYNLDMREGTGIATYGRTLDAALRALGAQTSYLFSRDAAANGDLLEREVAFYGGKAPAARGRVGQVIRQLALYTGIFSGERKALLVPPGRSVIVQPEDKLPGDILNCPSLFDRAFIRHFATGSFTRVTTEKPVQIAHLTYPMPIEVKGAKLVTTIHDLIPLRLPYTTLDHKREIVRRHRLAASKSDLLITVSESSKRDIVELLDVDPARIAVTYQTSDVRPLRPVETKNIGRVLSRYGLSAKGYTLFVGAIEPKKNLKRLLRAYLELDPATPLVVVGKRAWMWEQEIGEALRTLERRKRHSVIFLDYVSREDLRYLYAGAICLLFPSLYEGFGLPLLEAMQFGVPLLTSNTSSMPEIGGEAAVYVDPYDVADIRSKVERLLSDPALREWLSERALEQAARFTMDNYLTALAAAYQRLV